MTVRKRPVLDAQTRSVAPGQFVQLSEGTTHYQTLGPLEGSPVVFVNGGTLPLMVWDPCFEPLAGAGCRVLRYDPWGMGYSDRPRVDYTPELFDRQLTELLDGVGFTNLVHLVGLALGGVIGAQFAALRPGRTRTLSLIATDGFGTRVGPGLALTRAALVGELLMYSLGRRTARKRMKEYVVGAQHVALLQAGVDASTQIKGFERALLSVLRHMPIHGAETLFAQVGKLRIPTLLIWGKQDRMTSPSTAERVRTLIPHLESHVIDQAGHLPHYDQPDIVLRLFTEFFARNAVA